ncbi:MAG: hypothetical protein FWD26_10335 [Treponema sp.]|nr:hypothetical protein [Treponema sp.]
MKKTFWQILNIVLLSAAGLLIILITIGSIIALTRSNAPPPQNTGETMVFSGLGLLRIPLSNSSLLLLSIAYPYQANDTAFMEELAAKIGDFRAIAVNYFTSLPESALIYIDEEAAKQEILRRFNSNLRLGRISTLYFSDMTVIEAAAGL